MKAGKKAILERLCSLEQHIANDPEEYENISHIAINNFLKFYDNIDLPCSIALTPMNDIYSKWNITENKYFSYIFYKNGKIKSITK